MQKEIIKDYGRVVFKDNVLYSYFNENVVVTPDIIRDVNSIGVEFSEGKRHYSIADITLNVTSTKEARAYAADNEFISYHIASAVIGNSLPVNLLVNFFININTPKVPTRLFRNEKEALDWFKKIESNLKTGSLPQ